jgi:RNase P subunit RPR2
MTGPSARLPGAGERWRCAGCGNLTRFDVVRTRRTREFWHVDLAGAATVDDVQTLEEQVAEVTCRWCGRGDSIEYVPRL